MTKRHFPQFACSITVAWIGQWLAHCAGLRACPKNQNRQHFNFAWDLFGHFLKVAWNWVNLNLDVLQIRFSAGMSLQKHGVVVFFWHGGLAPCHGEGTHLHFVRQLEHLMMVERLIYTFSTHVYNSAIKRSRMSGNSRSKRFLGMKASHFSSWISGKEFFMFSDFENGFFHSLPTPIVWFYSFPSHSRILGIFLLRFLPILTEFAYSHHRTKRNHSKEL